MKTNLTQYSTTALSKMADQLVTKIAIHSSLDRVTMTEVENELAEVKKVLLDRMNDENVHWLKEQMIRVEA